MHNLFALTTNIQGGALWKKFSGTSKQNPWKILKKKFIFNKVAVSKNSFFTRIF